MLMDIDAAQEQAPKYPAWIQAWAQKKAEQGATPANAPFNRISSMPPATSAPRAPAAALAGYARVAPRLFFFFFLSFAYPLCCTLSAASAASGLQLPGPPPHKRRPGRLPRIAGSATPRSTPATPATPQGAATPSLSTAAGAVSAPSSAAQDDQDGKSKRYAGVALHCAALALISIIRGKCSLHHAACASGANWMWKPATRRCGNTATTLLRWPKLLTAWQFLPSSRRK